MGATALWAFVSLLNCVLDILIEQTGIGSYELLFLLSGYLNEGLVLLGALTVLWALFLRKKSVRFFIFCAGVVMIATGAWTFYTNSLGLISTSTPEEALRATVVLSDVPALLMGLWTLLLTAGVYFQKGLRNALTIIMIATALIHFAPVIDPYSFQGNAFIGYLPELSLVIFAFCFVLFLRNNKPKKTNTDA